MTSSVFSTNQKDNGRLCFGDAFVYEEVNCAVSNGKLIKALADLESCYLNFEVIRA